MLLLVAIVAGALPALHAAGPAHFGAGLFKHDANCTATCNDEELGLGSMRPPYECWGMFKHSCEWEGDDHAGKNVFACHGAFAGARNLSSSDSDVDARTFQSLAGGDDAGAFARCEGAATVFVKIAAKDEAAASVAAFAAEVPEAAQALPRKGLSTGGAVDEGGAVGMMFGYRCLGEMTYLHLPDSNATKSYTACKMDNVRGVGRKRFGRSSRSMAALLADIDAPHEAGFLADHVAQASSGHGLAGLATLVSGTPPLAPPAFSARKEATPDATVQQRLDGKVCSRTCNGSKPPLGGWWPCVGSLDISCKASEGDMCADLDMTCAGISLPAARMCRGLWTARLTAAKDDEKPVTQLFVDTGTTGNREVHKNGWAGTITYGRGLHYIHGSK